MLPRSEQEEFLGHRTRRGAVSAAEALKQRSEQRTRSQTTQKRSRWRPPGQEGSSSQGQGSPAKVRGTETRASRRKGKNPDDERDKESAGRTDMTQARLAVLTAYALPRYGHVPSV